MGVPFVHVRCVTARHIASHKAQRHDNTEMAYLKTKVSNQTSKTANHARAKAKSRQQRANSRFPKNHTQKQAIY